MLLNFSKPEIGHVLITEFQTKIVFLFVLYNFKSPFSSGSINEIKTNLFFPDISIACI
jgi:hypothetical protein